jgi:serine/threonine protein kinase
MACGEGQPVTTIVGNYELVAQLASGGMAETHIARSRLDGSIVVVKQLLPAFAGSAEFIEMFIDEGRVISSLRHPNVVALREFGFHAELPFLAMEYLHGVDLRTLVRTLIQRKRQQVPSDVALYIVTSMCAGLHHAHEARTIDGKPMQVTHRDVSPQNVVITFDGAVKLIDFGIATARGRSHETRAGALKGKIPYMAPEQVRSAAADRRADIYATGVVLYELLTRRRPYLGKQPRMNEFALMMAIANHEVVPIDTLRPDLPPALAHVVMKAISLEPEDRYHTAAAMQSDLEAIARDLGMTLGPGRLAQMMEDVIARHQVMERSTSPAQIADLMSEVEIIREQVDDERYDPSTVDRSELGSVSVGRAAAVSPASTTAAAPERAPGVVVDKIVERDRTRLRFLREPDPGFRWGRMLDGVEGIVEIDFTGVGLTSSSIPVAREALQALGTEVENIQLISAPIALAAELDGRCRIVSASCRGFCPSCATRRVAVLEYTDLRDRLSQGRDVPCPQCRARLVEIELSTAAPDTRQSGPRVVVTELPPSPSGATGSVATVARSQPIALAADSQWRLWRALPGRRRALTIAFASTIIIVMMAGVLVWRVHARQSEYASLDTGSAQSWRDGQTWVTEASGDGPSEIAALGDARLRALAQAITEIEAALPRRIKPLCADGLEVAPSLLDRPAAARIELEQLGASTRIIDSRAHVTVRYQMAKTARERALGFYARVESIWGLELINAPPSRRAGVLVIAAPFGPISVGDRIISVAGQPLPSLEALHQLGELRSRPTLELVIEHEERRTLGIRNTEAP